MHTYSHFSLYNLDNFLQKMRNILYCLKKKIKLRFERKIYKYFD